jgi:4-hydroxy-tetrahydrodipicolinate reductase
MDADPTGGAGDAAESGVSGTDPARLVVTGATGRMGTELRALATDRDDVALVAAVSTAPETLEESPETQVYDSLDSALGAHDVDCVVDFTTPDGTREAAAACADYGVALVSGTTGLDEEAETALDAASESVPVLYASNFSRGVAALRAAVREAAGMLPGYDVEVTETHHNGKQDAPSGTALSLVEDVEAEREDLTARQYGREGEAPRQAGEIGIHARRAGDVAGHHEVLFGANHETLSLSHRAGDRGVFAAGALDAAVWLSRLDAETDAPDPTADRPTARPPRRYDFSEVLR